jgi:hypothetical protein
MSTTELAESTETTAIQLIDIKLAEWANTNLVETVDVLDLLLDLRILLAVSAN